MILKLAVALSFIYSISSPKSSPKNSPDSRPQKNDQQQKILKISQIFENSRLPLPPTPTPRLAPSKMKISGMGTFFASFLKKMKNCESTNDRFIDQQKMPLACLPIIIIIARDDDDDVIDIAYAMSIDTAS